MVKLTRIYTKTGDDGTTSLADMSRTSKNDPRLEAYATVDEANSSIGVAFIYIEDNDIRESLLVIQNHLYDLGADLATPVIDKPKVKPLRTTQEQIDFLENLIDKYNKDLPPLSSFVIPGGSVGSCYLHMARTIVRRAERRTWNAIDKFGTGVNSLTAKYLNRLSDLLFVYARYENRSMGDRVWMPGR